MINHIFSSLNQKRRKPLGGKPFCYSEPFKNFFLSKLRFLLLSILILTGLFCTCKLASLNVELDVGINRIDLVSLWVMRHPCNQACFLAMNVISSNAVQLQSDGQNLLNQDNVVFFSCIVF